MLLNDVYLPTIEKDDNENIFFPFHSQWLRLRSRTHDNGLLAI